MPARKGDLIVATVEYAGVVVHVKRRRDSTVLQLESDLRENGKGRRPRTSARTSDVGLARERAREFALELAVAQGFTSDIMDRLVARGGALTLGEVFDLYREIRLPRKSPGTQYQMDVTFRHFEAIWGREMPIRDIDQEKVESFVDARLAGGYVLPSSPHGDRPCRGASPITVQYAVKRLNTVLRWVRGRRHNGERILPDNPLEGLEKPNLQPEVRQPIADARRFRLYLEYAPKYEAQVARHAVARNRLQAGFLTLLISLARWTGRRRGAISHLRFRDLLLDNAALRRALSTAGWKHQEWWADHWPFGAIRWVQDWDKMNRTRIVPISRRVHDLLVAHIAT